MLGNQTIWELPTAATGVWAYATESSQLNLHALLKFEVFLASDQKVIEGEELLNPNMDTLFARITIEPGEAHMPPLPAQTCAADFPATAPRNSLLSLRGDGVKNYTCINSLSQSDRHHWCNHDNN